MIFCMANYTIEFDDYKKIDEGEWARNFRGELPDGAPTVGSLACKANVRPPIFIFQEQVVGGGDRLRVVRTFNARSPENARSTIFIKWLSEFFYGQVRAGSDWAIESELTEK
jgi:hypothetical protein